MLVCEFLGKGERINGTDYKIENTGGRNSRMITEFGGLKSFKCHRNWSRKKPAWSFHLKQDDDSSWIKIAIEHGQLSHRVAEVENQALSPNESRDRIRSVVAQKYMKGLA